MTIKSIIAIVAPLWVRDYFIIASPNQQPNINPSAPLSQNHLVAHTVKRVNNSPPKSHHLNPLIKNHQLKKQRNTHNQSLLLPNLQIDPFLLDTPPLYPTISIPYPPIKVKRKYTKHKHKQQQQPHQTNTSPNNHTINHLPQIITQ